MPRGNFASANQKHYRDLGSDTSSVWNFCARSSVAKKSAVFQASSINSLLLFLQASFLPYPAVFIHQAGAVLNSSKFVAMKRIFINWATVN